MEEVGKAILEVFAADILRDVYNFTSNLIKYKNKCFRVILKNGQVLFLWYKKENIKEKMLIFRDEKNYEHQIPIDCILLLQILTDETIPYHVKNEYSFTQMKYNFNNFPDPFITDSGKSDCLIVYGEGSRDISDYNQRKKIKKIQDPRFYQSGRRGDFDYLISLSAYLGYHMAKRGNLLEPHFPRGSQGFSVSNEEKINNNLITVGSGAINSLTKDIFSFYGDSLPIRFSTEGSDDFIVCETSDKKLFRKRIGNDENIGMVAFLPSPYNRKKYVLILAGLNVSGTQAAVLSILNIKNKPLKYIYRQIDKDKIAYPISLVEAKDIIYNNDIEIVNDYMILDL